MRLHKTCLSATLSSGFSNSSLSHARAMLWSHSTTSLHSQSSGHSFRPLEHHSTFSSPSLCQPTVFKYLGKCRAYQPLQKRTKCQALKYHITMPLSVDLPPRHWLSIQACAPGMKCQFSASTDMPPLQRPRYTFLTLLNGITFNLNGNYIQFNCFWHVPIYRSKNNYRKKCYKIQK